MIKSWIAFWCALLSCLLGLIFWKNWRMNKPQSWKWISLKSLIDFALIICSAIWLPPLLIAWAGVWITRPIKHPALRATVGVIVGVFFAICALEAIEVLALFSVLSIDTVTGEAGFLGHWYAEEQPNKRRIWKPTA
jgi:hypothetical protein